MAVLAIMLVMGLLAFGLHYQQSRARAVFLHQEADMQSRQALEFELARENSQDPFSEPHLAMKAKAESDLYEPSWALYRLSDLAAEREVSWDKHLKARPGTRWTEIKLSTHDMALQFRQRVYRSVTSAWLPYAALAPRGSVTLESVSSWSNPPLADKQRLEAVSGLPARVGARSQVTVNRCGYGELYSEKGPITVKDGAVLAQRGYLPYLHRGGKDYEDVLSAQIDKAFEELAARALDKTGALRGPLFELHDVWGLVTGSRAFDREVNLQQAMLFPIPMIPSATVEGIVTIIKLHMPWPPDVGGASAAGFTDYEQQAREGAARVEQLGKELEGLTDPAAVEAKKKELAAARAQVEQVATQSQSALKEILAASTPTDDVGPSTRAGETWFGDEGQLGWSYKHAFGTILQILAKILTGQLQELGEASANSVRLFQFGREENPVGFEITPDRFGCVATVNVPPGRSLTFEGSLTVAGDLWIQKGASLVVKGDLTMTNPAVNPLPDPVAPQGRVCLEEGATLLVTGSMRGAGSPVGGSVVVGAPAEGVHPVTAGLLVQGNLTLPYGILPAVGVDELVAGLEPILAEQSPNLAKAAGPFHRRKSYFAKFATTFVIIELPFPPIILFLPIPLPEENILNPVFNSLSSTYASHLNLRLGENFMTMTDWWFFGQGIVPMLPKLESFVEVKDLKPPTMPLGEAELEGFTREYVTDLVKTAIFEKFSGTIVKLVVANLGLSLPFVGEVLTSVLTTILNDLTRVDKAQELASRVTPVDLTGPRAELASELAGGASSPLLGECPGVLVYSGQDLTVAAGPLTVGFLVARGKVDCRTEYLVGAAVSLEKDVAAQNLLFVPELTRVQLYLPEFLKGSWQDASLLEEYGAELDSGEEVPIGPPVPHVRAEGWEG